MNDKGMTVRSLKEQFSRASEAWKEQSEPIFRFWADGDCWGFPYFSLSAGRYFGDKETLCLYWQLGLSSSRVRRYWISTLGFVPIEWRVSRPMEKTSGTLS